jgi:hypothetical protein
MGSMQACLILLTLAVSPSTTQVDVLQADWEALVETVQRVQNATSELIEGTKYLAAQLLIDLEVLKSRQAVAGAIQGVQVFLFLAYLATIAVRYLIKRCRKHQKEVDKAEFELLETRLQASRSRRRAAAAARTNKQTPQ